ENKKKAIAPFVGKLTSDVFSTVISEENKLYNEASNIDENGEPTNEAFIKMQDKQDLHELIALAYSEELNYNYYAIRSLMPQDGEKFYERRTEKINRILDMDYADGNYTEKEKQKINEMNESLKTPFYYEFFDGWTGMLSFTYSINVTVAILVLILLAPIFSGEYQQGSDSILLTTRKGHEKLGIAKITVSFLCASAVFVIGYAINFLSNIILNGVTGWNCPVQLQLLNSVYNLNMLQTYLLCMAVGYVAVMSVAAVTVLLSAKLKSPFLTIIASALIFFVPMAIPHSRYLKFINYGVSMFPINIMDTSVSLRTYKFIDFFGILTPLFVLATILLVMVVLICIPFSVYSYKHHQVN
ncbi:MAG: hypothetical protein RR902_00050, partial [Oscillospiraceae bacterium]